jgi:hypothetical protein
MLARFHRNLSFQSFPEVVTYARKNPEKLVYAVGGVTQHIKNIKPGQAYAIEAACELKKEGETRIQRL